MKYFYVKPEDWEAKFVQIHYCDHPLYNAGTLFTDNGVGLVVVQQRFNQKQKVSWWGPIDPWLVDEIACKDEWPSWFEKHAEPPGDGLYPTYPIRKIMWAMRMKPLKREFYEKWFTGE